MLNNNPFRILLAASLMAGSIWMVSGCSSDNTTPAASGSSATTKPMMAAGESQKGGAQLWGENCARCHNYRPPQYYSDAQWDLIVHHMRVRANLTGAEAREITKFLQASN